MRLAHLLSAFALATALTPATAAEAQKPSLGSLVALNQKTVETRRPLPLGSDDWRFGGEIGTRVVPMYLLPSEATRPAKVRVSYLSAVSVMPEVSRLTVTVNDTVVGERYVQASSRPEALTFDIPVGVLEPGYNAVRITARQVHRVDCSREASYELWTQILPEQSGLVFQASPAEIRDIRDLPAVRPGRDGAVRIRARASSGIDADSLQRVSRAVQAAVLAGQFSRPVVEVNPEESGEPGLDIVVGTDAVVEGLVGQRPSGAGPRLQIAHDAQTDRVLLVVTGSSREDVETALQQFEAMARGDQKLLGTPAGLRALTADQGRQVSGNETVSLASLGFETQRFGGRYYRQSGNIQLPADFYPGDYGRMTLSLDAAYGAELAPNAKINVRVNGALVSTVPLPKGAGDTLNGRQAYLPLSAFKPGLNSIDVEADTATTGDAECSATSQLSQRDRLLLANSTDIEVPKLARIGTFPSLSSVPAGGLAAPAGANGLQIYLPNPNGDSIEASLSLVAKIAAVSGRATPVTYAFDRVAETTSHVIAIGALSDIPPATLEAAGLNVESLRRLWQGGEPAVEPAEPKLQTSSKGFRVAAVGNDFTLQAQAVLPSSANDGAKPLGSSLTEPTRATPSAIDTTLSTSDLTSRAFAWFPAQRAWIEDTLRSVYRIDLRKRSITTDVTDIASANSTLVISQGATPKAMQTSWRSKVIPEVTSATVFVAPNSELLRASMTEVLNSGLWQQLTGRAAAYDRKEASISSGMADVTWFVPTQTLSPGNLRLIVAGWLSQNVLVYLSALILVVTVLTTFTYRLVKTSGVRES